MKKSSSKENLFVVFKEARSYLYACWLICFWLAFFRMKDSTDFYDFLHPLRADVSKYRPEVCKSEKSKILKKIHKVALGKLLT